MHPFYAVWDFVVCFRNLSLCGCGVTVGINHPPGLEDGKSTSVRAFSSLPSWGFSESSGPRDTHTTPSAQPGAFQPPCEIDAGAEETGWDTDRQTAHRGEHSLSLGEREGKRRRRGDAEGGSETVWNVTSWKSWGEWALCLSKCSGVGKKSLVTSFSEKEERTKNLFLRELWSNWLIY